MPKSNDKNMGPSGPGTNPNTQSQGGSVNPSAPSVGTEQWGNTSDERQVLGGGPPAATRAGQLKGNPGDDEARGAQKAENERRGDAGDNQADLSRRTSPSAHSMNTSHGGGDHTYRCADAGNSDCRW